jgi:hypothetical protein
MPTLEAPLSTKVPDGPPDPVDDRTPAVRHTDPVDELPVPRRTKNGRDGSPEVLRHCLDLAVTGNQAASKSIRRFVATVDDIAPLDSVGPARQLERITAALEMTQRLAHAPLDLGRTVVHSTVVVDVDVDVDVASRQRADQASAQEEGR